VLVAGEVAVPAQEGVRGDHQVQPPQRRPWQSVQEGGEECPVGRSEVGSVDLALQNRELMAQRKNFDVLVHITHRQ
jgi:hypothetical protein